MHKTKSNKLAGKTNFQKIAHIINVAIPITPAKASSPRFIPK